MILGIETSGERGSVACWRGGEAGAERVFSARQDACRRLPPAVRAVLAEQVLSYAEIRGVAVSGGPGSFNGLRVGMAFAKAFAHAAGHPVVAVPTPRAWAWESSQRHPHARLAVLQPVRRGFLYLSIYAPAAEETLFPTAAVPEAEWQESALTATTGEPLVLTGDWPGLGELPALPARWLLDEARPAGPSALTIARLAAPQMDQAPRDSVFSLRPAYLSPSQAERMRGVDLGL